MAVIRVNDEEKERIRYAKFKKECDERENEYRREGRQKRINEIVIGEKLRPLMILTSLIYILAILPINIYTAYYLYTNGRKAGGITQFILDGMLEIGPLCISLTLLFYYSYLNDGTSMLDYITRIGLSSLGTLFINFMIITFGNVFYSINFMSVYVALLAIFYILGKTIRDSRIIYYRRLPFNI